MGNNRLGLYIMILAVAGALSALINRRGEIADAQVPVGQRKLSMRTVAAAAMILLAVPLTIFVGVFWFGDRKYYFISLLIILETMLPFFLLFEGRKTQARELVIISVLCALGVAGRAAFFMLPQFKPVAALVIISGVAFGGETGFLVGAVTMLVSNIMFSQGPWTPGRCLPWESSVFSPGCCFARAFSGAAAFPFVYLVPSPHLSSTAD
jgi:energy-coupling factor transport system ATP-binding protein